MSRWSRALVAAFAGGARMFPKASTWAVVLRFVTFNVFVILVDSAMNSRLLCSLTGNRRE